MRQTLAWYAENVPEYGFAEPDLRWSPADSPHNAVGDEHFAAAMALRDRIDPYDPWGPFDDAREKDLDKFVHVVRGACFGALADLDHAGYFGVGAERDRVVISVVLEDESNREKRDTRSGSTRRPH